MVEAPSASPFVLAKNITAFPVGDFTAAYYQHDLSGPDGTDVHVFEATANVTMPVVAGNHGRFIKFSTDWAARLVAAPNWITASPEDADIVGGTGLKSLSDPTNDIFPATGNAELIAIADATNNRWVFATQGSVSISQYIPAFDNAAERDAQTADLVRGTGAGDLLKKLYFRDSAGMYEQVG